MNSHIDLFNVCVCVVEFNDRANAYVHVDQMVRVLGLETSIHFRDFTLYRAELKYNIKRFTYTNYIFLCTVLS